MRLATAVALCFVYPETSRDVEVGTVGVSEARASSQFISRKEPFAVWFWSLASSAACHSAASGAFMAWRWPRGSMAAARAGMGASRGAPARDGSRWEMGKKWGGACAGSSSSPSVSAPGASSHGNGDVSRLSLTKDDGVEYGDARSTSTSTSSSSLISRRAEGKRAWSAGGSTVVLSPQWYELGAVLMCRASDMADGEVRLSSATARARTAQRRGGHRGGGERAAALGGGIQCCSASCEQRMSPSCHRDSDRRREDEAGVSLHSRAELALSEDHL